MASSGMLRHVALVRTDVLEEHSTSFIRVTRIGEPGTTLAVTSNRRTLHAVQAFTHPFQLVISKAHRALCASTQAITDAASYLLFAQYKLHLEC
jgi:hypothetical protein